MSIGRICAPMSGAADCVAVAETRHRPACSITSKDFITSSGGTRRWDTSAPWSSKNRQNWLKAASN